MNIVAILPARMGATRFPGKPLAKICGMPMIGHVYHRTAMNPKLMATYVATCDQEIYDYIRSIGGNAVMTADTHERCSDRTAEAMLKIERELGKRVDIVAMVQGDEPKVHPDMIDQALEPMLKDPSLQISNLMAAIPTLEDFEDPNEVKVVVDRNGNALYFSREPIPSRKKGFTQVPMRKQLGLIVFRRDFLLEFNEMEPTLLEKIESVDMMRLVENGQKVRMVMTDVETIGVDTPEDLEEASRMMMADPLLSRYAK